MYQGLETQRALAPVITSALVVCPAFVWLSALLLLVLLVLVLEVLVVVVVVVW